MYALARKNQGLIEDEVKARATEALKMVGIDESLYEASPFGAVGRTEAPCGNCWRVGNESTDFNIR